MSIRKIFFILTILTCSACSSDLFITHNGNYPSAEKIAQIQTGQTKEQVFELLGSPSLQTGLSQNHWIYMSSTSRQIAFMNPTEIDRNVLAITFKDNKVSKIEAKNLADGNNISIDNDETKLTDRDDGFFRKYFGGVGTYNPLGNTNSGRGL